MTFKCGLVNAALRLAHRSMNLDTIQPKSTPPKCFPKKQEQKLEGLNEFIIFNNNTFMYRYNKGEASGAWGSMAADDLDALILGYYKGLIEMGSIQHRPTTIEARQFGYIHRNFGEWKTEQAKFEQCLSAKLDRYLDSFLYRMLRLLFQNT
jgi:hypothetical protein